MFGHGWRLDYLLAQDTQDFGDAPGLSEASAGQMRRVTLEDLSYLTNATITEMIGQAGKELISALANFRCGAMHANIRGEKRPKQPGPYRALVVGSIAAELVATILAKIARVGRPHRTQSHRREQFAVHGLYDRTR